VSGFRIEVLRHRVRSSETAPSRLADRREILKNTSDLRLVMSAPRTDSRLPY